jgi:predicted metal-binding membrane protein
MTVWQDGVRGAFITGLRHGLYCTGCCWLLMALLFVVGVMNLLWIAVLAAAILLEKTLPNVRWLSTAIGLLLGAVKFEVQHLDLLRCAHE